MINGLNSSLLGARIETADVEPVTMDLRLHLANGVWFTVFCDSVHSGEDDYSVFDRDYVYIVGAGSRVRRERRTAQPRPVLRGL